MTNSDSKPLPQQQQVSEHGQNEDIDLPQCISSDEPASIFSVVHTDKFHK